MNVLIIIPARGGSKGIARKNLRKLGSLPLIGHSIQTALQLSVGADVFVSSEDNEILSMASQLGAQTHKRPQNLSKDLTTLDPVIYEAYKTIEKSKGKKYELIITMQPTSPLLKTESLEKAIQKMANTSTIDTLLSAVEDTHLTWIKKGDAFVPNYNKRVNRQELEPVYKETGGFLITRPTVISESSRIGKNVSLFELKGEESLDIDTYEDWNLCEYYLKRKKVLFVVTGNNTVGMGHVYNTLILANEILNHRVIFLTDSNSELAFKKIQSQNYEVHFQSNESILEDIFKIRPDVIINDRLDTDKEYVQRLKEKNIKVINIEDLGSGTEYADLVINAIYPEKKKFISHYYGPDYFCARDEFLFLPPKTIKKNIQQVLITFGGVDPNNLTLKTLNAIYTYCKQQKIEIQIILGMGYQAHDTLKKFDNISIRKDITNIAQEMHQADICFTSAGRTTYELALLGVPSIVLAQNDREMTHFFADEKNGFKSLGMGTECPSKKILEALIKVSSDFELRQAMQRKMMENNIKEGKTRVIQLIKQEIENETK